MLKLKHLLHDAVAAFMRVAIIFALLVVFTDSLTRVYFGYMPMTTWIEFRSVKVENRRGEAFVIIDRTPKGPQVATVHRSLIIHYPEATRACTSSTVTVLDNLSTDELVVPMKRLLSPNCPDVLQGRRIEGNLQVSYIFDFPYGVKRSAVRYSAPFALIHSKGVFVVSDPISTR